MRKITFDKQLAICHTKHNMKTDPNVPNNFQSITVKEPNETICQVCEAVLKAISHDIGNGYTEIEVVCPNKCIQDERVVIL